MKKLLIIGGLGPQASILFHKRVIQAAAGNNKDYPLVLHLSLSMPLEPAKDAKQETVDTIRQQVVCLGDLDGFRGVIACNTLHLAKDEIQDMVPAPIVSMVDAVKDELKKRNVKKVGVLATPISVSNDLYQIDGVPVIYPAAASLQDVEMAINGVLSGRDPKQFTKVLRQAVQELKQQECDVVILGCTELSVIMDEEMDDTVIDPLEVVLNRLIEEQYV